VVDLPPPVQRRLDQPVAGGRVGGVGALGEGIPAECVNRGNGFAGRSSVADVSTAVRPDVVDQDPGPAAGELQGVRAAETSASPGDQDDLAVKAQLFAHRARCATDSTSAALTILPLALRGRFSR
jgi:hypothetical protein